MRVVLGRLSDVVAGILAYQHFNLAMLFCRGGHGAEAKAEYRAAEALKPDLTKANPLPPHCPPDRT